MVALYERVLARIRLGIDLSSPIRSIVGVKQGCPLSPPLFALYIDDLERLIREEGGDGCPLAHLLIPILIYDDDIVLLCPSPEGCSVTYRSYIGFVMLGISLLTCKS